jgi:hypothetical protein
MAISRMSASLATAHNENTLALANFNFDISLLRVEVPTEYSGLAAALTNKRRASAEEGTAHRTARRLGILFQDILPSTPELLRAYGRRASEISQRTARKEGQLEIVKISIIIPTIIIPARGFLPDLLEQTSHPSGLLQPQDLRRSRYTFLPAFWLDSGQALKRLLFGSKSCRRESK